MRAAPAVLLAAAVAVLLAAAVPFLFGAGPAGGRAAGEVVTFDPRARLSVVVVVVVVDVYKDKETNTRGQWKTLGMTTNI